MRTLSCTPLATSSGRLQARPSWRESQITTSRAPSSLPPNHAASSSPGFSPSTMVEAWQEGAAGCSAINPELTYPGCEFTAAGEFAEFGAGEFGTVFCACKSCTDNPNVI